MTRLTTNQKGLGLLGVAVIVVAILALGSTGYLVYRAHRSSKSLISASTNTESNGQSKTMSTTTPSTVTPQGTYLDFKEVGVKILLNSSVSDAVYAPYHNPNSGGATVYGISTQSIINADGGDSICAASGGILGVVSVTTTPPMKLVPPNSEAPMTPDNKTLFKISNKYYQYIAPQNNPGCVGGTVTTATISAAQQSFAQSFASLQSDSTSAN